jgi:Family of unknown function (DUF6402)
MSTTNTAKLLYYKINQLMWTWTPCEGANGCQIVPDARLSLDKAPPPLRDQPPVEKPKVSAKNEKPDPAMKMLDDIETVVGAFSRYKKWLDTPDAPRRKKTAIAKVDRTIPSFDIQEIPGAMRKLSMPVSAKLMEKWLAGELNYSLDEVAEKAMINHDGKPYSLSMIDTTTVKMDWVLKYPRAKDQFELLINKLIYSDRARGALKTTLAPYRNAYKVHPWELCGNDLKTLHRHFQFQRASVDGTFEQKAIQWLRGLPRGGAPNDLSGALGAFNFYAAVAGMRMDQDSGTAIVTHIVVYVKDNYSFGTKPGEPSQYLGHWNSSGVILVPEFMATDAARWRWLDYPVLVGDMPGDLFKKDAVFYPIRNKTFREWQLKHKRGGDFVICTDYKPIRLSTPIRVPLQ